MERYEDFKKTSDIGRQLAALHLNYETLKPYPLEEKGDFSDTRVTKMKFGGKGGKDRSTLIVNGTLTLRGIPEEAYRYQVNGRSPIEWAVDRYQVRQDKASSIINDPNLWAPDNPRLYPRPHQAPRHPLHRLPQPHRRPPLLLRRVTPKGFSADHYRGRPWTTIGSRPRPL